MLVDPSSNLTIALIRRDEYGAGRFRQGLDYNVVGSVTPRTPGEAGELVLGAARRRCTPATCPPIDGNPPADPLARLVREALAFKMLTACRPEAADCSDATPAKVPARFCMPAYHAGLPIRSARGVDILA